MFGVYMDFGERARENRHRPEWGGIIIIIIIYYIRLAAKNFYRFSADVVFDILYYCTNNVLTIFTFFFIHHSSL